MARAVHDSARATVRRGAVERVAAPARSAALGVLASVFGARRRGAIRTSELYAHVSVFQVAAFDEPYNHRLHPTRVGPLPRASACPRSVVSWLARRG